MADANTCEHGQCSCTVPEGSDSDYCSPYCESAGDDTVAIACECNHPGCAGEIA